MPDRESGRKTKWLTKVKRVRRVTRQEAHGMLSENKKKKIVVDPAVLAKWSMENEMINLKRCKGKNTLTKRKPQNNT